MIPFRQRAPVHRVGRIVLAIPPDYKTAVICATVTASLLEVGVAMLDRLFSISIAQRGSCLALAADCMFPSQRCFCVFAGRTSVLFPSLKLVFSVTHSTSGGTVFSKLSKLFANESDGIVLLPCASNVRRYWHRNIPCRSLALVGKL